MGERLNVSIITNSKTIANCYMHWSAYPGDSMEIGKMLIPKFRKKFNLEDELNLKKEVVQILKETLVGSELCDEKELKALGLNDFSETRDRSNGLISVTKEGIEKTEEWQDGILEINIEEKSIYCQLIGNLDIDVVDSLDEFKMLENGKYLILVDTENNEPKEVELIELKYSAFDTTFAEFLEMCDIFFQEEYVVVKDANGFLFSNYYL